jgi:fucose 4-O-acetylase-like acetyltransferase
VSSARDPRLDNAKMLLVTLVVVGHSWTMLPHTGLNDHLYDFLYTWHMPAFVFITGYLSRGFAWGRHRLWVLVRSVAIPYVIVEAAMALFRYWFGGETLHHLFIDPHWPLWYLPALFLWRLATPLLRSSWVALPVAVVASLLGGLWTGSTLDLARVLGFLPFFVLGLHTGPELLERLRTVPARVAAVVALLGIWVLSANLRDWAGTGEWLYYNDTYSAMGASPTVGYVTRLIVLVAGAVGALAVLALVPRRSGWFTTMGSMSLIVYLGHGFFLKALRFTSYNEWAHDAGHLGLVATSAISVLIALFLAWRPVSARLQHVIDPLGYAESRLKLAAQLTVAADRVELPTHRPADDRAEDRDQGRAGDRAGSSR